MPPPLLTRAQLRKRALGTAGENDKTSFYGTVVNDWLNDALKDFYTSTNGVEDTYTTNTVVGQRNYMCPDGFLHAKLLLYNGDPLREERLVTQDFYDSGTGYIEMFTVWGWPMPQILLGPLAPSNVYPLTLFYYRTPRLMSDDSHVPELPDLFQPYLADYAGGMLALGDNDSARAGVLFQKFQAGRAEFQRFMLDNSRSNYVQVLDDWS